jgi:hypothetical protein
MDLKAETFKEDGLKLLLNALQFIRICISNRTVN